LSVLTLCLGRICFYSAKVTSIQNPHRLPTEPMGIHHSPHTHTIPIPMGIPMGIPIPTAALIYKACCTACSTINPQQTETSGVWALYTIVDGSDFAEFSREDIKILLDVSGLRRHSSLGARFKTSYQVLHTGQACEVPLSTLATHLTDLTNHAK